MSSADDDRLSVREPPEVCQHADDPCRFCRGIARARIVHSDELLQGQRELFILHAGQVYRLVRTRNDKLLLQK